MGVAIQSSTYPPGYERTKEGYNRWIREVFMNIIEADYGKHKSQVRQYQLISKEIKKEDK